MLHLPAPIVLYQHWFHRASTFYLIEMNAVINECLDEFQLAPFAKRDGLYMQVS